MRLLWSTFQATESRNGRRWRESGVFVLRLILLLLLLLLVLQLHYFFLFTGTNTKETGNRRIFGQSRSGSGNWRPHKGADECSHKYSPADQIRKKWMTPKILLLLDSFFSSKVLSGQKSLLQNQCRTFSPATDKCIKAEVSVKKKKSCPVTSKPKGGEKMNEGWKICQRASGLNVEPKEKIMIGLNYNEALKYLDFLV